MPFPTMDGLVFKTSERNGKHFLLVSSDSITKTYAWDAQKLHTVDVVIRDLKSVRAYTIENVVTTVPKALREGKR